MDYKPCNKNASKEVKDLLNYFNEIKGKKIITGQHTQTVKQEELSHIYNLTGYKPMLTGYELLGYSPNINPNSDDVCLTEVKENLNTLDVALKDDGIITFSFHWFSPLYGLNKSFYAENTTFDCREVLKENTKERIAFYSDLDYISSLLLKFKEINKPILWRPFHEASGTWFWWGKYGVTVARDLYILMYKYFVYEKHLDNLIWVWNSDDINGYPGDEYVDIISVDIYTDKHKATSYIDEYKKVSKVTNKLIALAECGVIPDIKELRKNNFPWIYFMTWSKEFIMSEEYNYNSKIIEMYNDKDAIKKDRKAV